MSENQIPSLDKAIDVLLAVAQNPGAARVKSLAQSLSISHTTCYRILQTFEARNWVRPRADGGFDLSEGLLPVVKALAGRMNLETLLQPVLDKLVRQVAVSGKVSVRQGDAALTVLRATAAKPMALSGQTGLSFPLAFGSSGSALLAGLSDKEVEAVFARAEATVWSSQSREEVWQRIRQCRENGICSDFGTYQSHVYTLSAPVRGAGGQTVAALTLLGLPDEFSDAAVPGLTSALRKAAAEAEAALAAV